ncbi:MAG: hypothetical protein K940chlam8_00419 [Chlamydiae bacterium]|nr:hypothetical protein [Chlamydiota bacterium]
MKKVKHSFIKNLSKILVILALLCAFVFALIYWYLPRHLIPLIETYAKKQDIEIKISKIENWFPLTFRADFIRYTLKDTAKIEIEDVQLELEKLFLMNRTFKIHRLTSQKTTLTFLQKSNRSLSKNNDLWPRPFIGIYINTLKLYNTNVYQGDQIYSFDLTGHIDITPNAQSIRLASTLNLKVPYQEEINFKLSAQKRTKFIKIDASFKEEKTGWLIAKLKNSFPITQAKASLHAGGHLNHWLNLLANKPMTHGFLFPKIKGNLNAEFEFAFESDSFLKHVFTSKARIQSDLTFSSNALFELSDLKIKNQTTQLTGLIELDIHNNLIKRGTLSTTLHTFPFLKSQFDSFKATPMYLRLMFKGPLFAPNLELNFRQQNAQVGAIELNDIIGTCKLENFEIGLAKFFCNIKDTPLNATLNFTLNPKTLYFQSIDIQSDLLTAKANLDISLETHTLESFKIQGNSQRVTELVSLIPHFPNVLAKYTSFEGTYSNQNAEMLLDFHFDKFTFKELYSQKADIRMRTQNPFTTPLSIIQTTFHQGQYKTLPIESLEIQTETGRSENFYEGKLFAKDVILSSKGFWNQTDKNIHFTIHELQGKVKDEPFVMEKKTELTLGADTFILTSSLIRFGAGFMIAAANSESNGIVLKLQDTPASLLSLLDPNYAVSGLLTGDLTMQQKNDQVVSHLYFQFENLKASYRNWPILDQTLATLKADFSDQNLTFDLIAKRSGQILNLSGFVPIQFKVFKVIEDKPLDIRFQIQENTNDLLQYLHSEGHVLKGFVDGDLRISNTLENPLVQGALHFDKGSYENFQTGLILENLRFDLVGNKNMIELQNLTAKDPKTGTMEASGFIEVDYKKAFPFTFSTSLHNFIVIDLEHVLASVNGLINLKGDFYDAYLSGKLDLAAATITLPDKIAKSIPNLPFQFEDAAYSPPKAFFLLQPEITVHLDLDCDVLGTLRVRGRGLNSKWIGAVKVEGTTQEPMLYGKLNIQEGGFSFAKHHFILTEGAISFDGSWKKQTQINLVAEQQVADLTVYIALRGPLAQPFLTLSSSPSLPQSALLARLLFNKDISEIDPFQAIQLAQTAVELSSGDSGILERIQRSTGLDRLSITTTPKKAQEETQETQEHIDATLPVAVQVGKEITKGVLITTTQGTTADSRSYSIEIDLKYNLILQLETNQQRDGKISLKWSKSY